MSKQWDVRRLEKLRALKDVPLDATDITSLSMCQVCANLGHDHIPATGKASADVMVVAPSPSTVDIKHSQPLNGAAGELFDLFLDEAELIRHEVYVTNVVKCVPPARRKATEPESRNCVSLWLRREIKNVNPRVVVVMGKESAEALLPDGTEFKHGEVITGKTGRFFLMVDNPTYAIRAGRAVEFVNAGQKLAELLDGRTRD